MKAGDKSSGHPDRLRILVVDDDRDFAEGMADVLELQGRSCEAVFTGEEAIRRSRDEDFDVIFMDVRLPGKSGIDCFMEIHACKPDTKVVIMTGCSVEQLLETAPSCRGAWLTLQKPFDTNRVLEMLQVIEPCGGVLIADDDPDFARSLREALQAQRYRVFLAQDGQQALDVMRTRDDIDALILDLRMPVKTGLEVFQEMREEGSRLPTIVVTGYPVEEARSLETLRVLKVDGVLIKPFNPSDLVDVLARVVGSPHVSPS